MQSISEDYLIPLVIGATSRSDTAADEERLSALISTEMVRVRNTFLNSPFIVISSLAEGENRLTVKLAIEHLNARLIAILPLPSEEWIEALPNEKDKEEFLQLFRKAESSIEISNLMKLRLGGKEYELMKDRALTERFAAAFIAEHSEILFAVCDDEDGRELERDTTSQIIKWIRQGSLTREFSLRENKTGLDNMDKSMIISINPVALIAAAESVPPEDEYETANDLSGGGAGFMRSAFRKLSRRLFGFIQHASDSLDKLYDSYFKHNSESTAEKGYERSPFINIIERIDGYNCDIRNYYEAHGEADLDQSKRYLLNRESDNELIRDNGTLQKIISLSWGADVLSQYYQKKTGSLINWIYLLFFVAVVLYGMIDLSSYMVLFYIGLLPVIALLVKRSVKSRMEDRFLDYRALAEGLRVQVFWTLCGIQENVSSHYLSKYQGLLTWIRKAVRSDEIITLGTGGEDMDRDRSERLDITKRLWIDSQLDYFKSKKKPMFIRSRQFGNVIFLSFVFTLLTAVVYGVYVLIAGVDNGDAINDFQMSLGVIAAVGVAAQAYKNKKAYDELNKRYSLTQQIYAAAKRELEIGDVPAEKVLVAVGSEALLENSDWLWTPLAEGSDTIVAAEALKEGYELQCALPFERNEYEKDFWDSESVNKYRTLLEKATSVVELDGSRATPELEDEAYQTVGRMVLMQSDILIAIWDGENAKGKGGTGQIVNESYIHEVPVIWINSKSPHEVKVLMGEEYGRHIELSLPELEIRLKRILQPPVTEKPDLSRTYFSETQPSWTWGFLFETFCDIFSGERIETGGVRVGNFIEETREEWRGIWNTCPDFPQSVKDQIEEKFLRHYSWADKLAKYYSNVYRSSFIANYLMAGLAVFFALLPTVTRFETLWVFCELVLIILIIMITVIGNWRRWHERWIDYRLLSEQLRQLRFLTPLGLTTPAFRVPAHDTYGDPRSTWVNWHFRAIVHEAGMVGVNINGDYLKSYRDFLSQHEIIAQIKYHEYNSPRFHMIHNVLHAIGTGLFVLTLFAIFAHLYRSSHWLTLCTAVFPAFAAAFYGIRTQGEFEQIAKKSDAMCAHLEDLREELIKTEVVPSYNVLSDIAENTAEIMSSETLDWRIVFQSKRLILPG